MTSKCCGGKTVIVTVYTETVPRSRHHHRRHCHDNFHDIRRRRTRDELLEYARHLRETSHIKPHSTLNQITAADRNAKRSSLPTCLGKWEFLVPNILRSNKDKKKRKDSHVSASTKLQAIVKSMQVRKKTSFLSKLSMKLQKRH